MNTDNGKEGLVGGGWVGKGRGVGGGSWRELSDSSDKAQSLSQSIEQGKAGPWI